MISEADGLGPIQVSSDGGVAVALLDNPPVNLLDRDLFKSLRTLISLAEEDPDVKVLVLRSANPGFFIAHYDVEAILSTPIDEPARRRDELHGFHQMCESYRTSSVITICEIAGRVGGGGGELAASCDMRYGSRGNTILCQMEVPLGILPGGSGTQRLPRLVGRGAALEIILGGDDIDGETLERWGWLNRLFEPSDLSAWVDRFARRLASFDAQTLALAKASTLAGLGDPTPGLREEAYLFQETLRLDAAQQRMRSFLRQGGQTVEGESRVGALGHELGESSS